MCVCVCVCVFVCFACGLSFHIENTKPKTLHAPPPPSTPQFLTKTENVTREKLQLVGVTSFLVAAKQHEPTPPHPDDCAYWTDHGALGG